MPRTIQRLSSKQMYQLNLALAARYKELIDARISQVEACKRLSEGLGFVVTLSALTTALEAQDLEWVRAWPKGENSLSSRELVEAVVRDHLKIYPMLKEWAVKLKEAGVEVGAVPEPSATLVRWREDREAGRRAAREAKQSSSQAMLPLQA